MPGRITAAGSMIRRGFPTSDCPTMSSRAATGPSKPDATSVLRAGGCARWPPAQEGLRGDATPPDHHCPGTPRPSPAQDHPASSRALAVGQGVAAALAAGVHPGARPTYPRLIPSTAARSARNRKVEKLGRPADGSCPQRQPLPHRSSSAVIMRVVVFVHGSRLRTRWQTNRCDTPAAPSSVGPGRAHPVVTYPTTSMTTLVELPKVSKSTFPSAGSATWMKSGLVTPGR